MDQLSTWFIQSKSGLDQRMSQIAVALEKMGQMESCRGYEETEGEDGGQEGLL